MNGQIHLGDIKPNKYFFSIAVLLGLMFTFIAPDDESSGGWLIQALQWQIQTVVPMLFLIVTHSLLSNIGAYPTSNAWFKLLISGLLACALFTPLALLSDVYLANESLEGSLVAELFNELVAIGPPIIIFWMAINAPFLYGWRLNRVIDSEPDAQMTQAEPKADVTAEQERHPSFYSLLPEDVRGELLYLKSELHYLLVITNKGKALILYSLKAASQDLKSFNGVQPHRSFWVSRDHIESLDKVGREGRITVSNGDTIPVSRSKMKTLKL